MRMQSLHVSSRIPGGYPCDSFVIERERGLKIVFLMDVISKLHLRFFIVIISSMRRGEEKSDFCDSKRYQGSFIR